MQRSHFAKFIRVNDVVLGEVTKFKTEGRERWYIILRAAVAGAQESSGVCMHYHRNHSLFSKTPRGTASKISH